MHIPPDSHEQTLHAHDVAKVDGIEESTPREIGIWPAIGWSVLLLVTLVLVQTIVVIPFFIVRMAGRSPADLEQVAEELTYDGTVVAVATCCTTVACVALVCLIVWIHGWPIREYLRLRWPKGMGAIAVSVGIVLAFVVCSDLLTFAMGREVVPEYMVRVYESSWLPLLAFALVVGAPVGEEVIFRSFMVRSFSNAMGPVVAICVSSALWAIIHMQYDAYGIATVFAGGLLLGTVYYRTSSTLLCIALHALWNLIATIEVVVRVELLSP